MIIDGINYGNAAKRVSQNVTLNLLSLFLMASGIMARQIRRDRSGLVYYDELDPIMPLNEFEAPDYVESSQTRTFIAENPKLGYVAAGIHWRGFREMNALTLCSTLRTLVTDVFSKSITESSNSIVDYASPACNVTIPFPDANVVLSSIIYGLSEDDCARYQTTYTDHANACHERYADLVAASHERGGILFFILLVSLVMVFCSTHHRRQQQSAATNYDSDSDDEGVDLGTTNTLLTMTYARGVEGQTVESSAETLTPSVREALPIDVQRYLNDVERCDKRVSDLSKTQLDQLEEKYAELCDSIYFSLMDIPVRMCGDLYDLKTLVKIPANSNGQRRNPMRSDEYFELRDIQAARDVHHKIQALITTVLNEPNDESMSTTSNMRASQV